MKLNERDVCVCVLCMVLSLTHNPLSLKKKQRSCVQNRKEKKRKEKMIKRVRRGAHSYRDRRVGDKLCDSATKPPFLRFVAFELSVVVVLRT